jgi:hypothetical protein
MSFRDRPRQPLSPLAACSILAATLLAASCQRQSPPPASVGAGQAAPITAEIVSTEPGQIELTEPRVSFVPPDLVKFEVKYRFTQGGPSKYYLCEVSFPGTENQGAKPMDSWELNSEGVIRDGIRLAKPPVEAFEIRVSEAESPQAGYRLISNVASGTVMAAAAE